MIRRFQFCATTKIYHHKNFFHRFISTSEQFVGGTGNNSSDPQENSSSQKAKTCTIVADFTTTCPFTCLGLTRSASKEQVRENFLQLAKVHHPDVGGEAVKFKRINAAYKQSIQQIETGYAAKIVAEMKAKKEKEEEEKNAYKAPHEREENYNNNNNASTTAADSSDRSKTSYYSASSTSYKNKYANPDRTSNFSSASSYSSAERHQSNHQSNERNASSRYYNDFMSRNTTSATSEKEGKEFIRNSQMRDERAKSHNKSDDWFKEMYESSWGSKKSSKTTSEGKSNEKHNSNNSETRKDSENKKQDEKSKQNKSSSSTFSSSSTDQEFDSDEGWFEFRENFFRSAAHSFSPRDMYRFRFSQATTVKEIDEIYNQAMTENIFSGYDIGEPLHLALERYHLELGLGEKHLEKCFEKIDDWEARTKSRAGCIYYQCILKIYTNERMLMLFPDMDASMAAEVVWKTLEKMQQNEVSDDTGIAWWNVLNSSLMYRDRHGYSYSP